MHLARARTLHRCVRRHDAVPLTADGRGSAEEFIVVPTKRVASYFSELLDLKIFEPPVQREASPSIFLAASREARTPRFGGCAIRCFKSAARALTRALTINRSTKLAWRQNRLPRSDFSRLLARQVIANFPTRLLQQRR